MRGLRLGLAVLGIMATATHAQDLIDPPPIAPDMAMVAAQQAYSGEPVAERMRISIGRARSSILIRMGPGERSDFSDGVLALEMGDVRVHLRDGVLTVVNAGAPGVYFAAEVGETSSATLERVLPPVPLPQLALARGFSDGDDLTPYTTNVRWTDAAWDDDAGLVRLQGEATEGPVTLELDRQARDRLRRMVAETPAGRFEIAVEPVDAGDPASWVIDTTGRERVSALSLLLAQVRPVGVGDVVGDLPLLSMAGEMRSVEGLIHEGPPEWTGAPDRRVVLVLAPVAAGEDGLTMQGEAIRAALAALDRLVEEADAGASDLCPFAAHLLFFVSADGFAREIAAEAAESVGGEAERILWSTFAPPRLDGVGEADVAAMVVDAQRVVLEIAPVGEEAELHARLRAALTCTGEE